MAHFKAVNKPYDQHNDVSRMLNYIFNPYKVWSDLIGALNVNIIDIDTMVNEFLTVKYIYGKQTGRQLRHFIVSFPDKYLISPSNIMAIAYGIAAYFSRTYQIVFSVHNDEPHIHIHFIMNSVSYTNGIMCSMGEAEWWAFVSYGQNVINNILQNNSNT